MTITMPNYRYNPSLAALSMLVLSTTVCADEAEIERITTTASRQAVSASALPLQVSSLDGAALDALAASHIQQALNQLAGVNLQRGNGQEYLPAVRSPVFSGAGACGSILTAEDGIPLRAAGVCNINELFEAHSEMAERIEVLKGPGSALYGSNAVHGVINVISPDTTHNGGMLAADYGSYAYSRLKLRSGTELQNGGIGINASLTHDGGYRDDEGLNQQKVNLRHRYQTEQWQVQTGLSYFNLDQDNDGYIEGTDTYKDRQLSQQNFDPEAYRRGEALRLWSRNHWQLSGGDSLTITPYVRKQNMEFLKHFLPGKPIERNSQSGIGLQSLWQHQLWQGQSQEALQMQLGVDGEYNHSDLLDYQLNATEGSAFLQETVPAGKHYDYAVKVSQLAPFVSLQWNSGAWLVSAGARFEYMHYDYQNNMLDGRTREDGSECAMGGCRYNRPPSGSDSFTNLSPKLGVSYRFAPQQFVYLNLARAYRAPQTAELYQLQRGQSNADLDAETASNIELGIKASTSLWRYDLAVYAMNKQHIIFRDSDFFYINDGESRHRGIELELAYQLADSWQVALAASHAKHTYANSPLLNEVDINGKLIDTAPRNTANLQLNWLVNPATTISMEWQHMGAYYTDPENQHSYPGHDLLNLRASWQLTEQLKLSGQITNLSDSAYAERADYTSFNGDRYFPGRPRQAMLSLSYRWY